MTLGRIEYLGKFFWGILSLGFVTLGGNIYVNVLSMMLKLLQLHNTVVDKIFDNKISMRVQTFNTIFGVPRFNQHFCR